MSVQPPPTNFTSPPPPSPSGTNFTSPPPLSSSGTNSTVFPNGSSPSGPFPPRPSSGLQPGTIAGLVMGTVFGAVLVLVAVGIFVVCYRRKKRKEGERLGGGHHQGGSKDESNVQPPQHWQQNIPPLADHKITLLPRPSPPPGIASVPQQSAALSPTSSEPHSISSNLGFGFSQSTFTYDELAKATDNFSDANLVGQGGFGYVHKGVFLNGKTVAIKQLKVGSGQGEREFRSEIEIISRIHHRHLVALLGYCITGSQRMLVYEFVPNKTLEFHLHGKGRLTMNWSTRMKIAIGSAKGLTYLHEDCRPKIIHRDIKASNILLDDSFEAKVADFGLAKRSLDTETHVSTRVMGTFGYLAPEYASTGNLTDKSDVFSFGVVLLELITGRRPVDRTQSYVEDSIVDWARPILKQALDDGNYDALIDPKLEDYDSSEMTQMISCAAACVRHSARLRPKMSQVVRALEGNLSLDELGDGMPPGHSSVFGSYGSSSDYNSSQYAQDLKKFRKMALESQEQEHVSSEYSGPTSDFGQHASSSSAEAQQITQDMEQKNGEKHQTFP